MLDTVNKCSVFKAATSALKHPFDSSVSHFPSSSFLIRASARLLSISTLLYQYLASSNLTSLSSLARKPDKLGESLRITVTQTSLNSSYPISPHNLQSVHFHTSYRPNFGHHLGLDLDWYSNLAWVPSTHNQVPIWLRYSFPFLQMLDALTH